MSTYVKERDYSSTTGMIMNERVPSSKYKYLISLESRFAKTCFFPGYVLYRRERVSRARKYGYEYCTVGGQHPHACTTAGRAGGLKEGLRKTRVGPMGRWGA